MVKRVCIFFFSSRRRHTISKRDWSSDVCSSDLLLHFAADGGLMYPHGSGNLGQGPLVEIVRSQNIPLFGGEIGEGRIGSFDYPPMDGRSEERRVGKECRWGRARESEKKTASMGG